MDPRARHRAEIEELAFRRLPVAMAAVIFFISGSLPIEWYYYPDHVGTYAVVLAVELALCAAAWVLARTWRRRVQAIATAWAAGIGVSVAAYYPLAGADATLAMAALICLVAAMPAMMPFGLRHQATLALTCVLALGAILALGVEASLPIPYLFIAFLAVALLSSMGAHSAARFRWEVSQREARLKQAQRALRAALGRAENTAEMRGRLVADVSHELRTPLNVIVGYSDMMLEEHGDPTTVAEAAPRIRDYALSLEALVTKLLDLSRLAHGKVDLTIEDIDVPALLDEVAEGARLLVRDRAVTVETRSALARYRSDRMRLSQILTNLATNAAKFTAAGTVTIRANEENGQAVFEVEDTGCGIPPAQHEQIFTAFEQVGAEPTRGNGVGLGLAIVRQLTDLLGGSVTVASTPGVGATFTVSLPGAGRIVEPTGPTIAATLSSPVS